MRITVPTRCPRAGLIAIAALSLLLLAPAGAGAVVTIQASDREPHAFDARGGPDASTLSRSGRWLATGLPADPVEAARAFLRRGSARLRVGSEQASGLRLIADNRLPGTDAHVLLLGQRFGGLPVVEGGLASVGVVNGKVAHASSTLVPPGGLSGEPRLLAQEAWRRAAAASGNSGARLDRFGHRSGYGTFEAGGLAAEQRVRLVALPLAGGGARRAYEANVVDLTGEPVAYTAYVDAENGQILRRVNRLDNASDEPRWKYFRNVPPIDGADTPDRRVVGCFPDAAGAQLQFGCDIDERTANPAAHGSPPEAHPRPWDEGTLPPGTTTGNNADTGLSALNPLAPAPDRGVRPVSGTRDYIVPWTDSWRNADCDPAVFAGVVTPPSGGGGTDANDINAAIVSLFANHNNMHDWSYNLGFTEATWNMQVNNYGKGGSGSDPEFGNAQGGALTGGAPTYTGRDNANQITPEDGQPGITNMYLWQPLASAFYPPCVDGDFDMSVVGHEYTHAISNRMVAGPSTGLTSGDDGQALAMGESFSDLTAVEYLQEYGLAPADDENPFAVGPYVTGSKQKGIRNYGMNDSPLNYSNVRGYDGSGEASPHDDGEIWSAVNYDIRQAFVAKYGAGNAGLQLSCAEGATPVDQCPGNRRWMQLVFDSYLLMPMDGEVSMVEARDALLKADQMRFGGANQQEMWDAFARRGFGEKASSGNPTEAGSFGDTDDPDPIPSFESPLRDNESTVIFKPGAADDGAVANAELFVGEYEANVTPVADSDPATPVPDRVNLLPGSYDFVVRADGYGAQKFTQEIPASSDVDLEVAMPSNRASTHNGAAATGDGENLEELIDDTEETNWQELGHQPNAEGTQVKVDLAGGARVVDRVNVSALLRGPNEDEGPVPASQNRFTALRKFELRSCNSSQPGGCDDDSEFTNVVYTSPDDAFPGNVPRPLAPDMILRGFDVPDTTATHLQLVVLTNQCLGVDIFHEDSEEDDTSSSDCEVGNPATPPSHEDVRAAELQVFSRDFSVTATARPKPTGGGGAGGSQAGPGYLLPGVCATTAGFRSVRAVPRGRRVRISFSRRVNSPVTVDVVRQARGRRVGRRLVRRFRNRTRAFTWNGRAGGRSVAAGHYTIGFRMPRGVGRLDQRRVNLQRSRGRFRRRPPSRAVTGCGLVRAYGLGRPVFGGTRGVSLGITFRLSRRARVSVVVRRGRRVVRRFRTRSFSGGRRHRLRLSAAALGRGDYRVTLRARGGGRNFRRTLVARRL